MSQHLPVPARPLTLPRRLRYTVEACGFFLLIGFFAAFGLDTASSLGGWIGRTLLRHTKLSTTARRNLAAAYPELSETARENILRGMWDNLGRVIAEYAHLPELAARVWTTGFEHYQAAQARGKGVILFSGHLANWESMPFAGHVLGITGATVFRPPNNPFVCRWIEQQRTILGMPELIAKGSHGTRRVFTLLRKGDSVCILVDQRTSEGVPAPYFGREAMTTPVPAALALKLDAVLLPITNERLEGAHFHMRMHPPIEPVRAGDHDRDILATTAAINAFFEGFVRQHPAQWLWIHRRWNEPSTKRHKRARLSTGAKGAAAPEATTNRL